MPVVKLTDRLIATYHAEPGQRIELRDALVPGLVMRLGRIKRLWTLVYQRDGQRRRYVFGNYPAIGLADARDQARALLRRVDAGDDPAAGTARTDAAEDQEDRPSMVTVADLIVLYLIDARLRKKSWRQDDSRAALHLVPAWGDKTPAEVTQTDMLGLMQSLRARGLTREPDLVRLLVSAIWRFGRSVVRPDGTRFCAGSPAADIEAAKPVTRDRVLTDAELASVWRACERFGRPEYGAIVQLLILTGQRRDEVAEMTAAELAVVDWPQLGFAGTVWTLPGRRTKNGRDHVVPLPALAKGIVDAWRPAAGGLLFPVDGRDGRPVPFSAWSNTKRNLDGMASAEMAKAAGAASAAALTRWTLHDLRRTVSTNLARLGVPPHLDDHVFNHVGGTRAGVRAVYNRYQYVREAAEALAAWEGRLRGLLGEAVRLCVPTAPETSRVLRPSSQ